MNASSVLRKPLDLAVIQWPNHRLEDQDASSLPCFAGKTSPELSTLAEIPAISPLFSTASETFCWPPSRALGLATSTK